MAAVRESPDKPSALILDRESIDTRLPEQCKAINPELLTIQLNEHFSLEDIVLLLEGGNIDRCFAKPYDKNLLKSEIYTHMLTPASMPRSTLIKQESEAPLPTYTAMIVDDESVATRFLTKQLRKLDCPCELLVADSAEQALELYAKSDAELALVISDQRMPGKQGHQLLNEIRQRNPDTIRMLTSAYEEVDVALNAVNEGNIRRYIRKPWQAEEIKTLISEAVHSYHHKKASMQDQRLSLEESYRDILTQRQARLEQALSAPLQSCLSVKDTALCLQTFFTQLQAIETLPASFASLRASRDTSLEQTLVADFAEISSKKLRQLQSLIAHRSLHPEKLAAALSEHMRQRDQQALSADDASEQNHEHLLAHFVVQCLQQVLQASGMQLSHCNLNADAGHLKLEILDGQCLPVLKHLLSAHTQVSPQMLEQQSSLLMLFIISQCTPLTLACEASAQGLQFSLQVSVEGSPADKRC